MKKGFTLIELLIVVAIIGIIAAIIFVTLDPLSRFQDARDSQRWSEISAILSAIKIDQVDNGGAYIAAVANATTGEVFMITDGVQTSGCANNDPCNPDVIYDFNCVDLSGLVTEGYLGTVPISPNGAGSWSTSSSGYTLQRDANGVVTIRACDVENTSGIWIAR